LGNSKSSKMDLSTKPSATSSLTQVTVADTSAIILIEMSKLLNQNTEIMRRNDLLNEQVRKLTQAQYHCLNYIHDHSPNSQLKAPDGTFIDAENFHDWVLSSPITTQGVRDATMSEINTFINKTAMEIEELKIKRNLNQEFREDNSIQSGPANKRTDKKLTPTKPDLTATPTRNNKQRNSQTSIHGNGGSNKVSSGKKDNPK
jgi:hypothetical protein